MPARIKQEPGTGSRANRTAVMAHAPANDAFTDNATEQFERDRFDRSAAPSVTTRLGPQSVIGQQEVLEIEDDDPLVLQVRINPKVEHETDPMGSQSVQGSFIGANRALKGFGQKLKDINDALSELQARGIQHVASLPELVLVGDQSSGKSSLMSAIAGLSLPRSSGTCTRCPIHIRVSRADEWSCRVFLKEDYEFVPPDRPLTERDVGTSITSINKFPPWVLLDQTRQVRREFKTVRDQFDSEEIETVLRCAQVAILNPSTPFQFFVPKLKGEASGPIRQQHLARVHEKEERSEAQFSPNTVALEVRGPDLADLNFYDLPGVFMTARLVQDAFLEKVVQNLTREYISRPSAIILCAVPMNQDTENSLALKIVRDLRAENRCIGVMTKADLLPKDDHGSLRWLAMLHGQAHQTGFGYFITSRQGSDLEEQNKMEEAFFNRTADSTGQWPEAFEQFRDRCGVEKLKAFLSLKLGEKFAKVLPEVKQKVDSRLQDINEQLEKYPDPPRNPELEIIRSLTEFTVRVKDRVTSQDFMNTWDARFAEPFKKHIIAMKPKFNVRENAKPCGPIVIDLESESPTASPTMRKRPAPATDLTNAQVASKRPRGPPTNVANGFVVKSETADHTVFPSTPTHLRHAALGHSPSRGPRSKSLMDIRNLIKRAGTPGQRRLVSSSVHEPLYKEAAKTWAPYLERFIDQTFAFLQAEILGVLGAAFSHLKNRAVYKESLEHMKAFVETHKKELRDQLMLVYRLETQRLCTINDESLERYEAAELKILVRHRNHFRIAAHKGEELGSVRKMEDLSEEELAQEAAKMAKELKNLGPDQFELELGVAAYVRGYYLTAATRFVDNVYVHVMSGLLPRVASVIDAYLHDKLGLMGGPTTQENLARFMSEGPEIEQKRRDLRAEKERLDGAMKIIEDLEQREREQAAAAAAVAASQSQQQQYQAGGGFDGSQTDLSSSVAHTNGVGVGPADRGTMYSATQFGDA
ncbi:hypothetical protein MFIFM68171_05701 [Madurella fahalii]|uniref:Uncharacterized protein n=1 Tax=Madurella fahalii TaxID=1157608 RepID=A0ABQ0GCM7_9PEZI